MQSNKADPHIKVILLAAAAVLILFPLAYSVVCFAFSPGTQSGQPFLERPAGKGASCLRETTYMRFHHMDLLKGIRDDAVRDGQRGEVGLSTCSTCHTHRDQFCDRCHNAVNLHLDCFGCHYYPTSTADTEN